MANMVQIRMQLECRAEKEGDRWVSFCPALQVYSQGRTLKEAKDGLNEAISLWLESCVRRGTLHSALLEVGFRPTSPKGLAAGKQKHAPTSSATKLFPIHVNTPAYSGSKVAV